MDNFTQAFIECLLWQSTDDNGEPLDMYSYDDLPAESLEEIIADCEAFQESESELLEQAGSDEQNGHDFCLTRNGHGAGFWDRGYGSVGDELSDACKPYGTLDVEEFEGKLYTHN